MASNSAPTWDCDQRDRSALSLENFKLYVDEGILRSIDLDEEEREIGVAKDFPWFKLYDLPITEWIKNPSDEKAVEDGCVFHYPSAFAPLNWWAKYLCLYEGEWSGQPFIARDWQILNTMRTYGWLKPSEKWGRWVRRHRRNFTIIAKKNGKSPTLAANGLYLCCGDGENGNGVYCGAKDGRQARRTVGKHAINMLNNSPRLRSMCNVNKNEMKIIHLPTLSEMFPIGSGDERSQKSAEGLNGSLLVDEIHVVDERFIERVERCGISRAEPLQIEMSTAGKGIAYGRRAYEYAKSVVEGKVIDTGIMVDIHEAPQQLEPTELAKDPEKYGRLANPMWGITIDPAEFLEDYNRSKNSPSKLGQFCMYRLDMWRDTADPWLSSMAWAKCSADYDLESLEGIGGGLGLDFARVGDLCAAVFVVTRDGMPHLWPIFWIPKHTTNEELHLIHWGAMEDAGHVRLTEGQTVDYGEDVLPELTSIGRRLKTKLILADPIFSGEAGRKVAKQINARYEDFPQQFKHYARPSADFEELIISAGLRHPRNSCLDWQVGHVMVKEVENMKKPIKDDRERHLRIDGIQAAIMGLSAWRIASTKKKSVYNTRGFIGIGQAGVAEIT
jgi:phage terminase large subunit-like protein